MNLLYEPDQMRDGFSDLLLGDGGHLDLALFLPSFLVFLHGLLAAVDATADAADDAGDDSDDDEGEDDDDNDEPGLHAVLGIIKDIVEGHTVAGSIIAAFPASSPLFFAVLITCAAHSRFFQNKNY